MEEMVTHIIVYLLKVDGTYIKEVYELSREMMLSECMAFAQDHREAISTYDDINNRWWLLLLPAVALLWSWNQETPTLKREKQE